MDIIPAIDLIGGECVRLTEGDYSTSQTYSKNPVDVAKSFEAVGVKRLHLVDLDGAKKGEVVHFAILEQIASQTDLTIDFSGGLRTESDIKRALAAGASEVSIGSAAYKQPEEFLGWINTFGSERIILSADVRDMKIAISGWTDDTEVHLIPFLEKQVENGIRKVICTDIRRDGLLGGVATDLYSLLRSDFPDIEIIASGGVASVQDLRELKQLGIGGVIIGKALYEEKIALEDLREFLC